MLLYDLLQHGEENACSAADLCSALGTTPRGLRTMISVERNAGAEILYPPGGKGGYFLPSTDPEQAQRERLAFYRTMMARVQSTLQALRPVAAALGRPVGQLDFLEAWEGDGEPDTQTK